MEIKQLDAVFRLTDRTEKEASGSLVIRRLDRMIRSNGQSIKKLLNESPKAPSGRVANEVLSQVLRRFVSPSRRRAQLARPAHWATFSFQVDTTSTRDEEKVNFYIIYCRCTSTHPAHIKDSTNCSQLRTYLVTHINEPTAVIRRPTRTACEFRLDLVLEERVVLRRHGGRKGGQEVRSRAVTILGSRRSFSCGS